MMLQKINTPFNHYLEEDGDLNDNSFICDFSKEDLSLIIEGEVKKTPAKKTTRKTKNQDLSQTTKLTSAGKKFPPQVKCSQSKLARSRSNYQLNPQIKPKPMRSSIVTEKQLGTRSRILESLDKKQANEIVSEFIKQDLK